MISQFTQQLVDNRHRGLVVIAGQWSWCLQQLPEINQAQTTLWLGESPESNTTQLQPAQTLQWLGQECDQLIINGFSGLDLNAFGAISGTLKAGGICYLLCPDLTVWPQQPDPQNARFCVYPHHPEKMSNRLVRHLINTIKNDNHAFLIEQQNPATKPITLHSQTLTQYTDASCKTEQQQMAVEKIKKVATGHRRRPLVLTADRGRGKSSALGIALSELLIEGKQKIIISAPQVCSVKAVFSRAVEQLTVIKQTATELATKQGTVSFMPPDELIRQKPSADLVMIDEAAAIPAPMLTELLKHYSRIVFTSTIHGYEGTGRGFEIRFKQTLNQLTPNWQAYSMSQPIRWAEQDPLEQFINQVLMLNAQAATVTKEQLGEGELVFTLLDRDKLLKDTKTLSQIIGLLTLSHYKTTPNDFRHLLDGSNIELYTQTLNGDVVGTTLIALEGNLSDEMCQQIYQGDRRPKGHLLPQTLSCHAGFEEAPKYSYARVIRIAIHPDLHDKGLGSQLLQQLQASLAEKKIDFIGSSFGATERLLRFWQQNEFTVVRLGITKEATSNEYSAVVLKPLHRPVKPLLNKMQHKFDNDFPYQLTEFYPLLSTPIVIQLLQQQSIENLQPLCTQERSDLASYIHHNREYEFVTQALFKQALRCIAHKKINLLNAQQQQLLVGKVLRRQPWSCLCEPLGFVGKKSAVKALKGVFERLEVFATSF
jgi:tRNA(Met) cytidine acetyltransferase